MNTKQREIIRQDADMTAEQLDDKYNPDGGGEHPVFTRGEWVDEVFQGHTLAGYWYWVMCQIEEEMDDMEDDSDD